MRRFVPISLVIAAFLVLLASMALLLLQELTGSQQRTLTLYARSVEEAAEVERLRAESEHLGRLVRTFLLVPNPQTQENLSISRGRFDAAIARMLTNAGSDEERELLLRVDRAEQRVRTIAQSLGSLRERGSAVRELQPLIREQYEPARESLDEALEDLVRQQEEALRLHQQETLQESRRTARTFQGVFLLTLVSLLAFMGLVGREVRDRRRAQESAEQNAAELEAILGGLPEVVLVGDERGIQRLNTLGMERLGVTRPQELGEVRELFRQMRMRDVETGEELKLEEVPYFQALQGRRTTREVVLRTLVTGEELVIRTTAAPVRLRGRVIGAVEISMDITERKRAEHALRLSEAKLAGIISIASDAIIAVDAQQRITLFNTGAERIFGYRREELLGQPLDLLLPQRFRSVHHAQVEAFARGPQQGRTMGERLPVFGLRKGGHEFPAEAAISKLEVEGERLLSVILRDTSAQRRQEEEQRFLLQAGELLASSLDYEQTLSAVARLAVQSLANWCMVKLVEGGQVRRHEVAHRDPERGELAMALKQLRFKLGQPILAHEVLETRAPLLVKHVTPEYLESSAQEAEHLRLLRLLAPRSLLAVPLLSGQQLLGIIVLLSDEPGQTFDPGDLGFAQELARLASLAMENARLYRSAQRATQARDEVLGIVAHDLRSPLNSISLNSQLLTRKVAEGAVPGPAPLRAISSAVQRMDRLIQDLLDVARLEGGTLAIRPGPQPATSLLEEAFEAARPLANELRLSLDGDEALPVVWADRGRVLQLFSNLLGNALKFTPPGGEVSLGARVEGTAVCFFVRDTGPGIPPELLAHLFDRFWQANRGDRRGTGLGLFISRGIVEAHGGRLWVESEPGRGSTFFFTLPLAPAVPTQDGGHVPIG